MARPYRVGDLLSQVVLRLYQGIVRSWEIPQRCARPVAPVGPSVPNILWRKAESLEQREELCEAPTGLSGSERNQPVAEGPEKTLHCPLKHARPLAVARKRPSFASAIPRRRLAQPSDGLWSSSPSGKNG